jgi:HTH-type transcriptional regulator/antitoxin HigA
MIQTEKEYNVIVERIEILLQSPDNIENTEAKDYIVLNILSNLVADYEERVYPIQQPSLVDVIKLRMAEKRLSHRKMSHIMRNPTE